ncbi:ATP-grasp domain-containing protein [Ferruginivarius sediminum]|uniref:D-alanine--D-alanine ligase n=1 Tax=Ferruginivarius sediminum TaxID=2661937 RepID=A0A369T6T8_9PROT|nr:D-alanine--D-alanine ligase [Ferruginivarius sediminum]RDD61041.1 D-alanine--D-alanine ligase [Ferruginivarius sediminum]
MTTDVMTGIEPSRKASQEASRPKTVFVIGWERFNTAFLKRIEKPEAYVFRPLLSYGEVVHPPYDVPKLIEKAHRSIDESGVRPDAIIAYWDFPSSFLLPLLRAEYGLSGPSLEAVLRCEDKYWSRVLQSRVQPELVPRFQAFDPFDDGAVAGIELPFPFWVKPIKAHSSHLGFKIHDRKELARAVEIIRRGIDVFAVPFNDFLRRAKVPAEIARIDGYHCLAEEIISQGSQCTLEGYALSDTVEIYGIVDSVRTGRHRSSFARYQYPSRLPGHVTARMTAAAERLIRFLEFCNGPFNVEFYWDKARDDIKLLEINARISKSHCPLFYLVDGATHQQVAVRVALGESPDMPHRAGRYGVAGKFMLRHFTDAEVRRVPDESDIRRLERDVPDVFFRAMVETGQRLAHLPLQDSYSFEVAELFIGAENQKALLEKYERCLSYLPFEFEDTPAQARTGT